MKIAVMPTYLAKCLEPTEIRVPRDKPKVVLLAYKIRKELEFVSRAQIKIDEHPVIAYKKFEEFLEGCEIALLRTERGKGFREVLVYKRKPPGNVLIFTKPSPLKGVIILRKQEEGEREENVMFARNLIREYYQVDGEGLVFVGNIRFLEGEDSVVGIGLETGNGIRYIMRTELKEQTLRPYAIVRSDARENLQQKSTTSPQKEGGKRSGKTVAKSSTKGTKTRPRRKKKKRKSKKK